MAAARTTKTQSAIPRAGWSMPSSEYCRALTFTSDDVLNLLKTAGITVKVGLDVKATADRLTVAATGFVMMSTKQATDAAILRSIRTIRTDALKMLTRMGADPQTGRLNSSLLWILASSDDSTTARIREEMGLLQVRGNPVEKMLDDEKRAEAEGRRRRYELRPGVDFVEPTGFQAVILAAYGLACMVKMTDERIVALGKPARRPRGVEWAEVNFVVELCRIYRSISGRQETLNRHGPAISFCCAAAGDIQKMLERLPPLADLDLRNSMRQLASSPEVVLQRIRDFRAGGHRAR